MSWKKKTPKKTSPVLEFLRKKQEEDYIRVKARVKHDGKNKDGRKRALVTPEDIKKAEEVLNEK